jgi:hypothetical protein
MSNEENGAPKDEPQSLVDDLGVHTLRDLLFGKHGKLFSAAGRLSPVVEVNVDSLVMHPPNKPFDSGGETEDIIIHVDERGILMDELGNKKRIAGAKFNGNPVYVLGETHEETGKNLVAALDGGGELHRLYLGPKILTAPAAFKLRNKTHDGELSIFSDLGITPGADE